MAVLNKNYLICFYVLTILFVVLMNHYILSKCRFFTKHVDVSLLFGDKYDIDYGTLDSYKTNREVYNSSTSENGHTSTNQHGKYASNYGRRSKLDLFSCAPNLDSKQSPCLRVVNTDLLSNGVANKMCVEYNITERTPICIHDPKLDIFISGSLSKQGVWEADLVGQFGQALKKYQITDVLDLGCNLGVYTFKSAKLGKRVVAVDANLENLRLLSKSVILGKLQENVTLIWNAMSHIYTKVAISNDPKNIGGQFIKTVSRETNMSLVETIKLDDLESMFQDKTVAIKMDIERSVINTLRGGTSFFRNINVRFVQIEVAVDKDGGFKDRSTISSILTSYGFTPFIDCLGVAALKSVPIEHWNGDVCFIKD